MWGGGGVDFHPLLQTVVGSVGNKHLANVLSGHLQMKPVPMQYSASKDNETACKKVGSYVFQSLLAMTRSLAHSLNGNNE